MKREAVIEMVCVVCPRGCRLTVGREAPHAVSGNACPRGERYGRDEVTAPRRSVSATCPIRGANPLLSPRRVPVRTTDAIPRERVADLVAFLLRVEVSLPVRAGDVLVENWENTGVSVIATRDIG